MKVTLEERYKDIYTMNEYEVAKKVIVQEKDDEETAKGWAEYAVKEALKGTGDYLDRVIEATATTAKNCRAWDAYFEGSGNMDVWIKAIAKTIDGFIEVGACLTDIWQSGSTPYKDKMFITRYVRG